MCAGHCESARWAGGLVLATLVAGLGLASVCKSAQPAAGPGPSAAPAANTPEPSASAAVVPGKPPLAMPEWYAPLFVAGNRWRYSSQTNSGTYVTGKSGEGHVVPETAKFTVECRTSAAAVLGGEALATVHCVGSGQYGFEPTSSYLAGPKGLYRDPTVKNGIVLKRGTLILKDPIAPFKTQQTIGEMIWDIAMAWSQGPTTSKGTVQLAACKQSFMADGETQFTLKLAAGIGIAEFGKRETFSDVTPPVSTVHTLQEFIPAVVPAPPVPGQLSLSSEGERLAKGGLRCADQVGIALAAGEPGQAIRISPGGWADVYSDVRPGVAALRGKVGKCSLTIETRNSNVTRLGSFWTGKPGELAALQAQLGAPIEMVELTAGSSATAWKVSEGILLVYQPTTRKPEYEWWLYDAAQWTAAEKTTWQAYAFNDAAMELADSKDPAQLTQAAAGLREATKLVPTYSRAWLRLCKVAQKIGKPTKDFAEAKAACGKAQLSAFGDVRKEAEKLMKGMGN